MRRIRIAIAAFFLGATRKEMRVLNDLLKRQNDNRLVLGPAYEKTLGHAQFELAIALSQLRLEIYRNFVEVFQP
jgi:hypothetical protein